MMYSSDGQRLFSLFINLSYSSVDSVIYVALSFVFVVAFLFFCCIMTFQVMTEKGKQRVGLIFNKFCSVADEALLCVA